MQGPGLFMLFDLGSDNSVNRIISRLKSAPCNGNKVVKVDGTWGSYAPLLAGFVHEKLNRPMLYVSAHIDDADGAGDDLSVFCNGIVETFPVWEDQQHLADATDEIGAQRLRLALGLVEQKDFSNLVISTCVQALNQPVPQPVSLKQSGLELTVGVSIEPALVSSWLSDNGFEHVEKIDLPGQFAVRGGIIDIYAPVTTETVKGFDKPSERDCEAVRVEFFGDEIESIRRIDVDTQLSHEQIEAVCVVAAAAHERLANTELFINLLPSDTIIFLEEPIETAEVSNVFLDRTEDPKGLYSWESIYRAMNRFSIVEVSRFASSSADKSITVDVGSCQEFENQSRTAFKGHKNTLARLAQESEHKQVVLFCDSTAEMARVKELMTDLGACQSENFKLERGFIRQGFIINSLDTIVISHHEIFGQYGIRKRIKAIRSVSVVESAFDLNKGDYIVHISYGIGRFRGLEMITSKGAQEEYLKLEFAEDVIMHVPVRNISLVQKYVGSMAKRPKLSRIGTKKWERQKAKVANGVKELAAELLDIQAKRRKLGGFAFGDDSLWQSEFEELFPYQETPDQTRANSEIKTDMAGPVPMDRLLCGDVGYGKTELAMRAAFKAVEAGKQAAVLVPTTVLCVQHGRTFAERFADFPVTIEVLNRFVTGKRAKEIISRAKQGKVDILIGTHRLLSKDLGFRDLGLLIIDEEQRFGVEHKEKLKRFRVNVDVLTLTATPIPRTLHMSMLGLRDISSLQTAPLDRRSIVTRVARFDKDLIKRAVMSEINREGQVFFVHNRVQSIERMAHQLSKIINDKKITIDIAHGQMSKRQLEDAMLGFVTGKTDVLVCSAIIESGLDIPNANTMLINDADRFGLAQLHQLRGRVGRYKHRAHAYMLMPAERSITPVGAKRLKSIEEFSQLGSGFKIALRDLEIRGAGNILGPEQSGHINTVGYELYCKLLSQAVKNLKDEPVEEEPLTVISLGFSLYIPKSYIASDRGRMDVYRSVARCRSADDLQKLSEELKDRYGPSPAEVAKLLDVTEIRIAATKWGIKSIFVQDNDVIFTFEDDKCVNDIFARAPGKISIPDPKTVYMRLEDRYFEQSTFLAVLRRLLRTKK